MCALYCIWKKNAGFISTKLKTCMVMKVVQHINVQSNTYFGMCRKGAGPISIKPALQMKLPVVTITGLHCGCGKEGVRK